MQPSSTVMSVGHEFAHSGALIADVLDTLQGLHRLRCSHNSLDDDGVPWEAVHAMSQLTQLRLDHNRLASLGSWRMTPVSIQLLDLSHNRLKALPPSVGSMARLRELNVSHNALASVPLSLGVPHAPLGMDPCRDVCNVCVAPVSALLTRHPQNACCMSLDIRRIPEAARRSRCCTQSAGECSSLTLLDAASNKLCAIPEELAALARLRTLRLDDNRITTLPSAILKGCSELQQLSLTGNPLLMEVLREIEVQLLATGTVTARHCPCQLGTRTSCFAFKGLLCSYHCVRRRFSLAAICPLVPKD
jgi:Leucine-rich repeat (LRR) protein